RGAAGATLGAVLVFRDVSKERHAEEELRRMQSDLRRSEGDLRATLYSIGDGVLATDEQARVTRINPVAERLTGWQEPEALGRPLGEVFVIINEETRAEAPNPVRSEEHTSELQSLRHLVCRLLLEKKKKQTKSPVHPRRALRPPSPPPAWIRLRLPMVHHFAARRGPSGPAAAGLLQPAAPCAGRAC